MDSCISVSFLAPKYWATAMLTPAPMEVQMAVRSQVMELVSPTAPRAVALMRFPTITLSAMQTRHRNSCRQVNTV